MRRPVGTPEAYNTAFVRNISLGMAYGCRTSLEALGARSGLTGPTQRQPEGMNQGGSGADPDSCRRTRTHVRGARCAACACCWLDSSTTGKGEMTVSIAIAR